MQGPVLVSGASGFLGRHVLNELPADSGAIALVRDPELWRQAEWVRALAPIETLRGSVTAPEAWRSDARLQGLRGIFHLAAVVRHSRREAREVYETNVDGTLHMVQLAAEHGCRMVFLSTSGTVGCFRSASEYADEQSPYRESEVSRWPYYDSKVQAERRARVLADELGVDLVILRPPILLGPGDHRLRSTANVERFLARRLPFLIRGGMHFADVRDVAQAAVGAMTRQNARPVYHLPGTACDIREFFGMLADVSGVPAPRLVLPFRLAWLAAQATQRLGIFTRGEPLHLLPDPVVIEMAARYWDIRSLYAADDLAYKPRAARETLTDTVRWLLEEKKRTP